MLRVHCLVVSLLRREVGVHKLRYSKTLRADWAGALLGAICGLFVGYLGLASVGAVAVDLSDLTSLAVVFLFTLVALSSAHRALRSSLSITQVMLVSTLPVSALIRRLGRRRS